MKLKFFLHIAIVALVSFVAAHAEAQPRERLSFNSGWLFQKGDPAEAEGKLSHAKIKDWVNATGAEFTKDEKLAAAKRPEGNLGSDVSYTQPGFDDSGWRKLNLPHDWGIEGPFKQEYSAETGKLPWWGIGWYRKHFTVPAGDAGRKIFLEVDGAMSHTTVWLNGNFVGGWPYGYSSWRLDLTPFVKPGADNVLSIRLDNPPWSSRWYPGGGIYRNVWLVKTSPVHVGQWGTFVTTPEVSKSAAQIQIKTAIANDSAAVANVTVRTALHELDSHGRKVKTAVAEMSVAGLAIAADAETTATQNFTIGKPRLWDVKNPNRYAAVTTIEQNGKIVDSYETIFGIRKVEFTADNGFLLNGERVHLNGVCNHHDLGPLGSAINTRALERQVELLKEMGCNAIRTSHNPPAPELLDVCDRMGLVVLDEAFDVWAATKGKINTNSYAAVFSDWHEKDLRALIRRDRNHPCVVLWSIGNEIPEQGGAKGLKIAAELAAITHDEDPTRLITAGCNKTNAGYNGFQKIVTAFGFNYHPDEYGTFHKANPEIPLYGSETASCVSSRGEYFFPASDDQKPVRKDFQVSSYDIYAPEWAMPPDREFRGQDEFPFVAGEFVWTGFDYLGEPTPYWSDTSNKLFFTNPEHAALAERQLKELGKSRVPSRSSYFGILDLCGFKKDRFYIYQARWRPDFPMAHILPHWNWPERVGETTPVHVYTSGDEAELFLNNKSLGKKKKAQFEYRLRWNDVKYQPGELKVVAYKNGKRWATDAMKTAGVASKLVLQADHSKLRADGNDLSFITVSIADKNGMMVPRTKNLIRFEISGPGEIVAVDSGDPTSHEPIQAMQHTAFNGLCLAIVRTKAGEPGKITLKASADGLADATISLRSK